MIDLNRALNRAFLHSFRNVKQFLEIELSNESYEEIIFFIDCVISSNNEKINEIVDTLNGIDSDISNIAFFVAANNKKVIDVINESNLLKIKFSNDYVLCFHLEEEYEEPLSISFRKIKNENEYESINFP